MNVLLASTTTNLIGLVVLILDIIAIVMILKGNKSVGSKVLWILLVLFLPLLGMILYFLLGRGSD